MMPPDFPTLLAVARGDRPADLVLRGGRIVDVFSGVLRPSDVAIVGGTIAGVGQGYEGSASIDCRGRFVAPGFIDAHVHIESSLCLPPAFAAAVVPRGVTTVVADPHEIANVSGVAGVRAMAEVSRELPLSVEWMAPSCVPATPLSTAGATLDADDIAALLSDDTCRGLAEVMNYPGVIAADPSVIEKIARTFAHPYRPIDGHAPGVIGRELMAYAAAGCGSDHEAFTIEEAREKIAAGLRVLIREASNARHLDTLLPLITPANARRLAFCTDDRTADELLTVGGIDDMVRRAIAGGLDLVEAFRLATLNAAEWFGLDRLPPGPSRRGAVAPGFAADLFVFDDPRCPVADEVVVRGDVVARGGRYRFVADSPRWPVSACGLLQVVVDGETFRVRADSGRVRVIGLIEGQVVTEMRVLDARIVHGYAEADASRDVLKMAVLERHGRSKSGQGVGIGFVQGIGLRAGAIAGTVAHDHHNLVVIGVDDVSMRTAAEAAASGGGGLAVAIGDLVRATLPLPVAGLMSDRPVAEVAEGYGAVVSAARSLGSPLADPFMAMSFAALEVIPSLKLTDQGPVDVDAFRRVSLFV